MDQLTHTVCRSNWINIIRQCQDRPAGTTAKQWLAEKRYFEKILLLLAPKDPPGSLNRRDFRKPPTRLPLFCRNPGKTAWTQHRCKPFRKE